MHKAGEFELMLTPADAIERLRDFVAALDADGEVGSGPYKNRRIATELRDVLAMTEGGQV